MYHYGGAIPHSALGARTHARTQARQQAACDGSPARTVGHGGGKHQGWGRQGPWAPSRESSAQPWRGGPRRSRHWRAPCPPRCCRAPAHAQNHPAVSRRTVRWDVQPRLARPHTRCCGPSPFIATRTSASVPCSRERGRSRRPHAVPAQRNPHAAAHRPRTRCPAAAAPLARPCPLLLRRARQAPA